MTTVFLDADQIDQLVTAVLSSPFDCWRVLRSGGRFTPDQQQRLVDGVAKEASYAAATLIDAAQVLTVEQKTQLRLVS